MKKTLTLLAVTVMTVNSVGCCCCRGLRDWCFQGASCGPRSTLASPLYATAPTPTYGAPMYAAAPSVPVFSHCSPQSPCAPQPMAPQYAQLGPAQMSYNDMECCSPYMTEMGCGMPYMSETDCCCSEGMMMPSPEMYPGPGPE